MTESRLILAVLAVLSLCVVALTVSVLLALRDLRTTLSRIDALLPDAGRTLSEIRRSFHQINALVSRANESARHVDSVVRQACVSAVDALDRFEALKARAQGFLKGPVRNGARSGSRRHD